jgi:hypothetical protein
MQCLYCKKKLGLFASRKRPFCSEQHEVAFNDEQAGLAMRRVLDPLFTEPVQKAPLQAMPRGAAPQVIEVGVVEAPPVSLTPPPVPLPIPVSRHAASSRPLPAPPPPQSFVPQPGPLPYPPESGVPQVLFESEWSAAQAQLPERPGSLLEFTPEDCEQAQEAAPAAFETVLSSETILSPDFSPVLSMDERTPDESVIEVAAEPVATVEPDPVSLAGPAPSPVLKLQPRNHARERLGGSLASLGGSAVDPPQPALRYPFAELEPAYEAFDWAAGLDVDSDVHGEVDLTPPDARAEATVTPWSAMPLDLAAPGDRARPAPQLLIVPPAVPELETSVSSAMRLEPASRWTLLEPRPAAAPQARWKVFSGLREAPAKLRMPRPCFAQGPYLNDWKTNLGTRHPETIAWIAPDCPSLLGLLALEESLTWAPVVGYRSLRASLGHREMSLSSQALRGFPWGAVDATPVLPACASEDVLTLAPAVELAVPEELVHAKQRRLDIGDNGVSGLDGIRQLPPQSQRPAAELVALEGVRELDQIRTPGVPVESGSTPTIREAELTALARHVQNGQGRFYGRGPDSLGFQRVRPASYIQIREPEFRKSNPAGRFAARARLPWEGVRPKCEARLLGAPVRLRPAVRTPQLAA